MTPNVIISPGAGNILEAAAADLRRAPLNGRIFQANQPPSGATFAQALNFPYTWVKDPLTRKMVRYNPSTGNYQVFNPATGRVTLIAAASGISAFDWLLIAISAGFLIYLATEKQ